MCGWDSRAAVWASRVNRSPDVLLEGELGRQHLDRDAALEPLVAGAIDHAHAAAADLAFDACTRRPSASARRAGSG